MPVSLQTLLKSSIIISFTGIFGYYKFLWTLSFENDAPSYLGCLLHNATGCPSNPGDFYSWVRYGTGWSHIGGPYSILWWVVNLALGGWGLWSFRIGWLLVDSIVLYFVARRKFALFIPYSLTSFIFFIAWPQDLLILWMLTRVFWQKGPWLVIAPLTKLPLGAPLWVWQYVFFDPHSVHDPNNWMQYAILGVWWTVGLVWLKRADRVESLHVDFPAIVSRTPEKATVLGKTWVEIVEQLE